MMGRAYQRWEKSDAGNILYRNKGNENNWSVGDHVMLYNPHIGAAYNTLCLTPGGAGWRADKLQPNGIFRRSDGTFVMLLGGWTAANIAEIGYATSTDLINWTIQNGDDSIFKPSGNGDWYDDRLFASDVMYLPHEE